MISYNLYIVMDVENYAFWITYSYLTVSVILGAENFTYLV